MLSNTIKSGGDATMSQLVTVTVIVARGYAYAEIEYVTVRSLRFFQK